MDSLHGALRQAGKYYHYKQREHECAYRADGVVSVWEAVPPFYFLFAHVHSAELRS